MIDGRRLETEELHVNKNCHEDEFPTMAPTERQGLQPI